MSTPTATRRSHPEDPSAAVPPAPTGDRRRLTLVRMVAAAHLVAGVVMALSVVGNLALRLNYTGGPMGYYGAESVGLAGCFHEMTHLRVWDASAFWAQFYTYSGWLTIHAQTSPTFFGLMTAVHLGLAGLCAGIGFGLWRLLPWARTADRVMVGVSAALATTHGVVLLASGFGYVRWGLEILAMTAVVVGPILILLGSPRTAALFDPSAAPAPRAVQERRWWTLSAQWLVAALVGAFAFGLVRLLFLGPLVEVVWSGVLVTRPGLGF
jgi:hypothetical protein